MIFPFCFHLNMSFLYSGKAPTLLQSNTHITLTHTHTLQCNPIICQMLWNVGYYGNYNGGTFSFFLNFGNRAAQIHTPGYAPIMWSWLRRWMGEWIKSLLWICSQWRLALHVFTCKSTLWWSEESGLSCKYGVKGSWMYTIKRTGWIKSTKTTMIWHSCCLTVDEITNKGLSWIRFRIFENAIGHRIIEPSRCNYMSPKRCSL